MVFHVLDLIFSDNTNKDDRPFNWASSANPLFFVVQKMLLTLLFHISMMVVISISMFHENECVYILIIAIAVFNSHVRYATKCP